MESEGIDIHVSATRLKTASVLLGMALSVGAVLFGATQMSASICEELKAQTRAVQANTLALEKMTLTLGDMDSRMHGLDKRISVLEDRGREK